MALLVLAYYALQLPEVQSTLTQKATDKISKTLGGNVSFSKVKIKWFDEATFEDINIKDLKGRDMIYVRELYVNFKTNLKFNLSALKAFDYQNIISFDNNLDFVSINSPDVKIFKETDGMLNIDNWIIKIQHLNDDGVKSSKPIAAFTIDNAFLKNGKVRMQDPRSKPFDGQVFDYFNFSIEKINANLSKLYFKRDTMSFDAKTVNGYDKKSNLDIRNITTRFFYCNKSMQLNNLEAKINNSYVSDRLHFYYAKPSAFNDFYNKITLKINLKNSKLDAQDLGRFAPYLYNFKDVYTVNSVIEGKYVDLNFKDLDLKFGNNSYLKGSGNFKGFPNLLKTISDFNVKDANFTANDVNAYTQNTNFQKYTRMLNNVSFSGTYKGIYDDFQANFIAQSPTVGNLNADMHVNIGSDVKYKGLIALDEFSLSEILDEPKLQKLSFKGELEGLGFDKTKAEIQLNGLLNRLNYNNYDFKNLNINGKLGKSVFTGLATVADANLDADFEGTIDFSNELNLYKLAGVIRKANLEELGFINDKMAISSKFDFDFKGNKIDDWVGKAQFLNTKIYKDQKVLLADSLFFNSVLDNTERKFSFESEFFNFNMLGKFQPTALIDDLAELRTEYLMYFKDNQVQRDQYYSSKFRRSRPSMTANYRIQFKSSDPIFNFFAPDFTFSPGAEFDGNLSANNKTEFSLNGHLDSLSYKNNKFYNDEISFSVSKAFNTAEVISSLDGISRKQKFGNGLQTENLKVNAYWDEKNQIDFNTNIDQLSNNSFADIYGKVQFTPQGYELKINPGNSSLVLLNDKWIFSENNSTKVAGSKVDFSDLKLSQAGQSISLNGIINKNESDEAVLNLKDLNLLTLKPVFNIEIGGVANGSFNLKDFYKNTYLNSNVHIENLNYSKIDFGTLTFEGEYDNVSDKLVINGNLFKNYKELLRVNGFYDPKKTSESLTLKSKVKNLSLDMFGNIMEGVFSNMKGNVEGEVAVSGTPLQPIFNGELQVNKGQLKVNSSGTDLFFDDKIILNKKGFFTSTKGVELTDKLLNGNKALLKGGLIYGDNNTYIFDIAANIISKDGFKVMDLSSVNNNAFYGFAMAGGDVSIKGDLNNIVVDGNLVSKKGTKITIPLDGSQNIDLKQEGIPFLSKENFENNNKSKKESKPKTSGVALAFNLSLTPDAECEIIFDRNNNDVLDVFGMGRININYDTRGNFTINGPYEILSGIYNFSFQNLASLRKFNLNSGSRITWSGDPYEANIDMKASYTSLISLDRILKETTGQRFPVNVMVSLKDRLLTPTIKYEIGFDYKNIPIIYQTELLAFEQTIRNDEQQMSRNVSSVLVLNEFFPENIADAFTQQFVIDNVSNILSNQIGQLANKLNPNLEFGVQFGDLRQNLLNNMKLNFSYKFLDNRAKLSGNSSFINSLENSQTLNSTGQLSVSGELEYLLSQDGAYKFKLFSRSVPTNFYTFASTGNVFVSGGNLVISRNFNSINLFQKKPRPFPLGVAKKEEISMIIVSDSTVKSFE